MAYDVPDQDQGRLGGHLKKGSPPVTGTGPDPGGRHRLTSHQQRRSENGIAKNRHPRRVTPFFPLRHLFSRILRWGAPG